MHSLNVVPVAAGHVAASSKSMIPLASRTPEGLHKLVKAIEVAAEEVLHSIYGYDIMCYMWASL